MLLLLHFFPFAPLYFYFVAVVAIVLGTRQHPFVEEQRSLEKGTKLLLGSMTVKKKGTTFVCLSKWYMYAEVAFSSS